MGGRGSRLACMRAGAAAGALRQAPRSTAMVALGGTPTRDSSASSSSSSAPAGCSAMRSGARSESGRAASSAALRWPTVARG